MSGGGERFRQFMDTCEPFLTGLVGDGAIALGYPLTCGWFFPMRNGAVLLLRRRLYPTPGAWRHCGMAKPSTGVIKNYPGWDHEADMGFQYTVGKTDGNGYVSDFSEPTRLDFDGAADLITPRLPVWPLDVAARPIAGGAFRVTWRYDPWGEGAAPTDFQVFGGADESSIDYGTALGTVVYDPSAEKQTFDTAGFAHGTIKAFAVRARNSGGVAELNTYTTGIVRARANAPGQAEILYTATVHHAD